MEEEEGLTAGQKSRVLSGHNISKYQHYDLRKETSVKETAETRIAL